jgi:hypothetical protein
MHTHIDTTKITPPATMAELIALDAQREVPYFKARCNRLGIHVPGPNPSPAEILPYIQARLDRHLTASARSHSEFSGDYIEWKLIREEYEELIACLTTLIASARRTEPESKTNHPERPLQPNAPERTENESNPDQKRTESGSKVENSSQPTANPLSENSENPKTPEPGGSTEPTPDPDPEREDLKRILKEIPNMTKEQLQECIAKKFLPDPETADFDKYTDIYFQIYGPPPRVRAERLHPHEQLYVVALLEDMSLKKVQDKLLLPPPFGPYIHTSKSALRRLKIRHHARDAKQNQKSLRKQIAALLTEPDLSDADFERVTGQVLKLRMIESSLNPDPDLTQTKLLVDMLEKLRAGKLAERKLQLAESK